MHAGRTAKVAHLAALQQNVHRDAGQAARFHCRQQPIACHSRLSFRVLQHVHAQRAGQRRNLRIFSLAQAPVRNCAGKGGLHRNCGHRIKQACDLRRQHTQRGGGSRQPRAFRIRKSVVQQCLAQRAFVNHAHRGLNRCGRFHICQLERVLQNQQPAPVGFGQAAVQRGQQHRMLKDDRQLRHCAPAIQLHARQRGRHIAGAHLLVGRCGQQVAHLHKSSRARHPAKQPPNEPGPRHGQNFKTPNWFVCHAMCLLWPQLLC